LRAAFRHLKEERRRPEQISDESVLLEEILAPAARFPLEMLEGFQEAWDVPLASRAVLVLHFQQELSLLKAAAILGIPLGTVKSRLAAGLAALRTQFSRKGVSDV
jgi:RNA polymerase sigma-70 factor (ECF subfamily)